MIERYLLAKLTDSLAHFPVTGIIGPRQVGKTTLVKNLLKPNSSDVIYLDLERDSDIKRLSDPEYFLMQNASKTIILDEIQHMPRLFPLLRSLVDDDPRSGRFVILGSASPNLLRQSAESLAGRIRYMEMFPLNLLESEGHISQEDLWVYGGFPKVVQSQNKTFATNWYQSFIQAYTERDLPLYGLSANPRVTRQLLTLLASNSGGMLNHTSLANAMNISNTSVKNYMGYLESAFLIKALSPWFINVPKRLVKSPKVYIRDSGMLHYLLGIPSFDALMGNIMVGNSWEGFVLAQVMSVLRPADEVYFYRTQHGAEIDLLVRRDNRWRLAAEIKLSNAPDLAKGTYHAMDDLELETITVVTPSAKPYRMNERVEVTNLKALLSGLGD
jgi:uncharacterized protein